MITRRKHNTIFLLLSLLFLFFLLPLFLITKRSLQPSFSSYLNSDSITTEIKHDVSNQTIHPNPHHKTNKDDTFLDNGGLTDNSNVSNGRNQPNPDDKTSKDDTFVDNGGLSDKNDVSDARNNPNPDGKTSKDDTFGGKGDTFVDNGGLPEKNDVSDARNQSNSDDKTRKGDTFGDKGDTIGDNGGLSDNSDVSDGRNHSNTDEKSSKGDTFGGKGDTFVDNGGLSDKIDVSDARNHSNSDDKTSKGDSFGDKGETFGDNGGLSDNSTTEIKDEFSNERSDANPDDKTSKGGTFVEKGDTFGDKGGLSENSTTEIRQDISTPDDKSNKDETVVDKNGDGNETSEVPEVELSRLPRSGVGTIEDERGKKDAELLRRCNLFEGKWVKDEEGKNYPIYKPGTCPYVDEAYDCQRNGRMDSEYLKWRWKPDECELPRFSSTSFLERLRGKKLMLVGDSMNRNQFESLLCMLWEGLPDKNKMYEIHGYKITKGRGYYVFKFEEYDCTVEFVRSHFLVKEGTRRNGQGRSNPTLSIDTIDKSAKKWRQADILVFNTGHWWTHGKTARGKNYYKEGDNVYPHFDAVEAYRRAMKTWANWIDKHISPKKLVIYRGYSSAHFRGGDWDSGGTCNGEKEPVFRGAIIDNYPPKMKIVDEVIKDMKSPAVLLNVTKLTNFRKDGHPSVYGKVGKTSTRRQDCSHWCLPGVPDAWNELVFASMLLHQTSTAA